MTCRRRSRRSRCGAGCRTRRWSRAEARKSLSYTTMFCLCSNRSLIRSIILHARTGARTRRWCDFWGLFEQSSALADLADAAGEFLEIPGFAEILIDAGEADIGDRIEAL